MFIEQLKLTKKKNNTKWITVDENNKNRDIFYTPVILTNKSKTATQPRLVEQKKKIWFIKNTNLSILKYKLIWVVKKT